MGKKKWDIVPGVKINRVSIIEIAEPAISPSGRARQRVKCKCDCGEEFVTFFESFYSGKLISCGCYQREVVGKYKVDNADPLRKHHLYKKWLQIKSRCGNKKNKKYGGRGIEVCQEWLYDYHKFYYWSLENGFSPELEIDRKDTNGNYSPYNCRWVTREINGNNKRNNVYVIYRREKMGLRRACRLAGVDYKRVWNRIKKLGWSFEDALKRPVIKN